MERRLQVGRVAGVHGLAGTVKVESWCEPIEAILAYRPWFLVHRGRTMEVASARGRVHGRILLVDLPGLSDVELARALQGAAIEVPRASLPPPPAGQFYWADLEGLEVVTENERSLGRVVRVFRTGANDVLVVRGERERLIPFVLGRHVLEVDLQGGRLRVDWDPDF